MKHINYILFIILFLSASIANSQTDVDIEVFTNKLSFKNGKINTSVKLPVNTIKRLYLENDNSWVVEASNSKVFTYKKGVFASKSDAYAYKKDDFAKSNLNYYFYVGGKEAYVSTSKALFHITSEGEAKNLYNEATIIMKKPKMFIGSISASCKTDNGDVFLAGNGVAETDSKNAVGNLTKPVRAIYKVSSQGTKKYDPIPNRRVNSFVSAGNVVWGASHNQILKYENDKWTVYDSSNSNLPKSDIISLFVDKSKNLWVTTTAHIGKFNNGKFEEIKFSKSHNGAKFQCFNIDGNNTKWIGTNGQGMYMVGNDYESQLTKENSPLPSNMVHDIVIDKNNKVIALTGIKEVLKNGGIKIRNGDGIFTIKINNKYFSKDYKILSPLNSEYLNYTKIKENNGQLYSLCLYGFYKYENGKFNNFKTAEVEKSYDAFKDFDFDSKNNIWIGTTKYLRKVEPNNTRIVFEDVDSKVLGKSIWHVTVDKKDNVWLDTKAGLTKYDGTNWTNFNKKNSELPTNRIECLFCDSKNNMWVSTKKGLVVITDGKFTLYNKKNSEVGKNKALAINEDAKGNIWISTKKDMFIYSNNKFEKVKGFEKKKISNFFFYKDKLIGGTLIGAVIYDTKTKKLENQTDYLMFRTVSNVNKIGNDVWFQVNNWHNAPTTTATAINNKQNAPKIPAEHKRLMDNYKKYKYQYTVTIYPLDKLIK